MKTFEKYIQKYLTKLGYLQVSTCKKDLVNTLKVYKCLGKAHSIFNVVFACYLLGQTFYPCSNQFLLGAGGLIHNEPCV